MDLDPVVETDEDEEEVLKNSSSSMSWGPKDPLETDSREEALLDIFRNIECGVLGAELDSRV
mgnify:CR=1